jgi:tetraacyldisaccharide 4'-kinase
LNALVRKIERTMTGKSKRPFTSFFEALLYALSLVYGGIAGLRVVLYRRGILKTRRLSCKVVSIGNLTVGGTGKTPLTVHVVEVLRQFGFKPAVITRGYKGEKEGKGAVVSDGDRVFLGPGEAGDEPYLMACKLSGTPVVVGRNRFEGGLRGVREFGSDVLILDDGFQHMQLHRDVDILLIDAARPVGNGHLLPRGVLREPVSHVNRADALVVTRCVPGERVSLGEKLDQFTKGRPTFFCSHKPYALTGEERGVGDRPLSRPEFFGLETVAGRKVLAFSGIGNNEDFLKTVHVLGCEVLEFLAFSDHHTYRGEDVDRIQRLAERSQVDFILTTEKDYVRVAPIAAWRTRLLAVVIGVTFHDGGRGFQDYLATALQKAPSTILRSWEHSKLILER